ncbi:MAG: hypothetical protein ACYS6K_24275 [Planctomycetota bacterium]|jgi:hypothetical protein
MLMIVLFGLIEVLGLVLFLWLVVFKGYKTKSGRRVLHLIFVFLFLFFVWELWIDILPRKFIGIKPDISKRLMSPDRTKTAMLIRRHAFDLNFIVEIKSDGKKKKLFFSHDYPPDISINWNENIEWSADSSLIVLTINEPDANEPFMWAYDFNDKGEISNNQVIKSLWKERNKSQEDVGANSNKLLEPNTPNLIYSESLLDTE